MSYRTILIVEDDLSICESLQQALELEGYQVLVAHNGKEALGLLRKIDPPALILLDIMMPIMTGEQFLEIVNSDHILATIPVVVVSAIASTANTPKARAFIKKPIDLDLLLRIAKQYCG